MEGERDSGIAVLWPVFLEDTGSLFRAQDAHIGFNSSSSDFSRTITGFPCFPGAVRTWTAQHEPGHSQIERVELGT